MSATGLLAGLGRRSRWSALMGLQLRAPLPPAKKAGGGKDKDAAVARLWAALCSWGRRPLCVRRQLLQRATRGLPCLPSASALRIVPPAPSHTCTRSTRGAHRRTAQVSAPAPPPPAGVWRSGGGRPATPCAASRRAPAPAPLLPRPPGPRMTGALSQEVATGCGMMKGEADPPALLFALLAPKQTAKELKKAYQEGRLTVDEVGRVAGGWAGRGAAAVWRAHPWRRGAAHARSWPRALRPSHAPGARVQPP